MMLESGESNSNRFGQAFGKSAMGNLLKQAILEQELTFRNQVQELHRLYWTQKSLMKEFLQNEVNAQVGNSLSRNEGSLLRNHQRNFNLQLPADAFISADSNHNYSSEINLSMFNKKYDVGSGCNEITDLEDSMYLDSREKTKINLSEKNVCFVSSIVQFGEAQNRILKEQMAHVSCAGIDDSSLGSVNDQSRITPESKTVLFDLNMPLRDSEVDNSSQDSMVADNNAKNFNDIVSKVDNNVLSSAYPVEAFTGSSDGALPSINEYETHIFSIELSKQQKREKSSEKPSNREKCQEDTLSSHATDEDEALVGKFHVQYNSNDMSDCSSYEKVAQEPATLSITDASVITQSQSTENEMSYFGKCKSEEQDVATTTAAQALMAISFGGSAVTTEKNDVTKHPEVTCNHKSDQLQDSSDCFETLTVHLSEIQNDEIMPDIPRLNVTEKNERMFSSKRGKRLRNFKKEILPVLVPLSRHEVCQDLCNMNSTVRRNTFSDTGSFFVPVTCRRSRLYSGRRSRRSFPW